MYHANDDRYRRPGARRAQGGRQARGQVAGAAGLRSARVGARRSSPAAEVLSTASALGQQVDADAERLRADGKKNATPKEKAGVWVPLVPNQETGHATPEPLYEPLIHPKMVAEVPLAGLSFLR
jgi:hypothetical protein